MADALPLHDPGALNYAITRLCHEYIGSTPRYEFFNDVLGALEGAKLELYREDCAKYEDQKKATNGPIARPYRVGP